MDGSKEKKQQQQQQQQQQVGNKSKSWLEIVNSKATPAPIATAADGQFYDDRDAGDRVGVSAGAEQDQYAYDPPHHHNHNHNHNHYHYHYHNEEYDSHHAQFAQIVQMKRSGGEHGFEEIDPAVGIHILRETTPQKLTNKSDTTEPLDTHIDNIYNIHNNYNSNNNKVDVDVDVVDADSDLKPNMAGQDHADAGSCVQETQITLAAAMSLGTAAEPATTTPATGSKPRGRGRPTSAGPKAPKSRKRDRYTTGAVAATAASPLPGEPDINMALSPEAGFAGVSGAASAVGKGGSGAKRKTNAATVKEALQNRNTAAALNEDEPVTAVSQLDAMDTARNPTARLLASSGAAPSPYEPVNQDELQKMILNLIPHGWIDEKPLKAPVAWSKKDAAARIAIVGPKLDTALGYKGYRSVRATHGVSMGAWFYEVNILPIPPDGNGNIFTGPGSSPSGITLSATNNNNNNNAITTTMAMGLNATASPSNAVPGPNATTAGSISQPSAFPGQGCAPAPVSSSAGATTSACGSGSGSGSGFTAVGHVRIGWSRRRSDVETPIGFDSFSYAIRDLTGQLFHEARGCPYGTPFGPGDVIGCKIVLPDPSDVSKEQYTQIASAEKHFAEYKFVDLCVGKAPPDVDWKWQNSYLEFYKNGVSMGVAVQGLNAGVWCPAVALFKNAMITANFGPNFTYPLPENTRSFCEVSSWKNPWAKSPVPSPSASPSPSPSRSRDSSPLPSPSLEEPMKIIRPREPRSDELAYGQLGTDPHENP